jgi:hypothetical protein
LRKSEARFLLPFARMRGAGKIGGVGAALFTPHFEGGCNAGHAVLNFEACVRLLLCLEVQAKEGRSVMPLRDHFRPPLDDETQLEGFHGGWPVMIVAQLSRHLPGRYVAAPRVHSGGGGRDRCRGL